MPTGFFSRVTPNISFSLLLTKAMHQRNEGLKPIEYIVVDKVYLQVMEFENMLMDISKPISQYSAKYPRSITSPKGIWNCIEFKCPHDIRSIIVYTSGRSLPLYAAPHQESATPSPSKQANNIPHNSFESNL